jgi:hypothetical protein
MYVSTNKSCKIEGEGFNDSATLTHNEIAKYVKIINKHRLLLRNEHDILKILNGRFQWNQGRKSRYFSNVFNIHIFFY